jgi:hypothetical protein
VIDFLAFVGAAVCAGVLLSCAVYAAQLWRASRRAKWDARAREAARRAVTQMASEADSTPGEIVIRWD